MKPFVVSSRVVSESWRDSHFRAMTWFMILQSISLILSFVFILHYLYYIINSLLKQSSCPTAAQMQSEDAKFIKKWVASFPKRAKRKWKINNFHFSIALQALQGGHAGGSPAWKVHHRQLQARGGGIRRWRRRRSDASWQKGESKLQQQQPPRPVILFWIVQCHNNGHNLFNTQSNMSPLFGL